MPGCKDRALVTQFLEMIGEDPKREGLVDTPKRVIRACEELFAGYSQDPREILSTKFHGACSYDEMILLRDIEFYSTCEHHCLPFFGVVHIAYIPENFVIGISKLARLVDCFSRRLQIQEVLTQEIAHAVLEHVRPKGVGVLVEAQHFCMTSRGVRKQNAKMVTTSLLGCFKDTAARQEFLGHVVTR